MQRIECHQRLRQVKDSYDTVKKTVNVFLAIARSNPKYLKVNKLSLTAIGEISDELHNLYFVRIFACFESILRDYWCAKVKSSKPMTERLIASLAGKRRVPKPTLSDIQAIRDFRNSLIHDDHVPVREFTIDEALSSMNTFLARLPLNW